MVALPADNFVQLPIFETVLQAIRIQGSIVGTRLDLQEVFELHRDGKTRVLYDKIALHDVNTAFDDILKGANKQPRLVFDLSRPIEVRARPARDASSNMALAHA
jgi:propanol-preferring alcohol dehydrogenase